MVFGVRFYIINIRGGDVLILESHIKVDTQEVSTDYRRSFIHLIKEAYKATEYEGLVLSEERLPKPYTFSVVFKGTRDITSERITFSGDLVFRFSTAIPMMIGYLYNYLKSKSFVSLFGSRVLEKRFNLPMESKIPSEKVEFKILGAAVFSKEGGKLVTSLDEDIEEALNHALQVKMNYARKLLKDIPAFLPVKVLGKALKYTRVRHYGGMLDAFRGHLLLEGDKQVLDFLAKSGIGVRTGQGFGMVKVVRGWS